MKKNEKEGSKTIQRPNRVLPTRKLKSDEYNKLE